jgi:hypothetical protein
MKAKLIECKINLNVNVIFTIVFNILSINAWQSRQAYEVLR